MSVLLERDALMHSISHSLRAQSFQRNIPFDAIIASPSKCSKKQRLVFLSAVAASMRGKSIEFLDKNRSVHGCSRASDGGSRHQRNRRGRAVIHQRKNIIGLYGQYRLSSILLRAGT